MVSFLIQPVSGECCETPCSRSGPCDPCGTTTTTTTTTPPPCPSTLCVDDQSGGTINFTGRYYENGTYLGSPAYRRESAYKWLWRDWTNYPSDGWWTFSASKGSTTDAVIQSNTGSGGVTCPTGTTGMWTTPLGGGDVTGGNCTSLCVTGAVDGAGSWQTAACTNGTYVPIGLYGDHMQYQKIIPDPGGDCYPTGYYLVWFSTLDNAWHDPGWRLSTTGAPDGFGSGMQYEGTDTAYPWDATWTTISVAEGGC